MDILITVIHLTGIPVDIMRRLSAWAFSHHTDMEVAGVMEADGTIGVDGDTAAVGTMMEVGAMAAEGITVEVVGAMAGAVAMAAEVGMAVDMAIGNCKSNHQYGSLLLVTMSSVWAAY